MSRHYYNTKEFTIHIGYDRPLGAFFLQVERLDFNPQWDDDSRFIYASIEDPHDDGTLKYYREVLKRMGLSVPESMWKAVREDGINKTGNRCVRHLDSGCSIEPAPN